MLGEHGIAKGRFRSLFSPSLIGLFHFSLVLFVSDRGFSNARAPPAVAGRRCSMLASIRSGPQLCPCSELPKRLEKTEKQEKEDKRYMYVTCIAPHAPARTCSAAVYVCSM